MICLFLLLLLCKGCCGQHEAAESPRYGIFLFPPPDFCFVSHAFADTAVSDALFAQDPGSPLRGSVLELEFKVNGVSAAVLKWQEGDAYSTDEGLSHHFDLPELPDGYYVASLELRRAGAPPGEGQLGESAETTFIVDAFGLCGFESGGDQGRSSQGSTADLQEGKRTGDVIPLNVATGRPSRQSSTFEGQHAMYANDGETMCSSRINQHSQTVSDPF